MTPKILITIGAALTGIGVAAGAFGAHGLTEMVTPERLKVYETAVRYHLLHSVALMIVGTLGIVVPSLSVSSTGYLFLAGLILFSGSLYLLVLTDTPWLGAITPIGGVAWIVGWGLLALSTWKGLQ